MGLGSEVSFWHSKWLGEESLCCKFNRVYLNSEQKDNSVLEVGYWHDVLAWKRAWFQWETPIVQQLWNIIENFLPKKTPKIDGFRIKWEQKLCGQGGLQCPSKGGIFGNWENFLIYLEITYSFQDQRVYMENSS